MTRGVIIHARGLAAAHIPRHGLRSSVDLLITCKRCQTMKRISTMSVSDTRRMVSIVRAIRAGKWTTELPDWAPKSLTAIAFDNEDDELNELRAVQTAEAFIILAFSTIPEFDSAKFIRDCGFTR